MRRFLRKCPKSDLRGGKISMKGYGEFDFIKPLIITTLFIGFFMWLQFASGQITIQVTGQPTIDSLTEQLVVSQSALEICTEKVTPECVCSCDTNGSYITGFLFGLVVGFFGLFYFIYMVKPWLTEKIKEKMSKKKPKGRKV